MRGVVIFLLACGGSVAPRAATVRTAVLFVECALAPDAIPDDGIDDLPALRSAFATRSCVRLTAGTYDLVTPASPYGGRRPYAVLGLPAGAELAGAGPGTTLRFSGDAGGIDWQGIGAGTARIHDLAIDTATLVGTSEQTHAIRITGPATGTVIERVTFNHPQRGVLKGGDCIQFACYAATPCSGARIRNNMFAHCDRSGVAIHSGTSDLEITDNAFPDTGDQDIDGEGTGDNDGWLVAHNTFGLGPAAQGDMSIQIQASKHVRITDNTFAGRGLFLYGCSGCELDRNIITRTTSVASEGVIEIDKDSADVNVHDNTITRAAVAGVGYVIGATPHGTGTPSNLTINDNKLIQHTDGNVINATGVVELVIKRNTITYDGAPGTAAALLAVGSTTTRTTGIEFSGNTMTGLLSSCVRVSGSYGGTGSVTMTGNRADRALQGLRCENVYAGSMVSGPVTTSDNAWPAPLCGAPLIVRAVGTP